MALEITVGDGLSNEHGTSEMDMESAEGSKIQESLHCSRSSSRGKRACCRSVLKMLQETWPAAALPSTHESGHSPHPDASDTILQNVMQRLSRCRRDALIHLGTHAELDVSGVDLLRCSLTPANSATACSGDLHTTTPTGSKLTGRR